MKANMIVLRPPKMLDKYGRKSYASVIAYGSGAKQRIRVLHAVFKRSTGASAYAHRFIERYQRMYCDQDE